MGSSDMSVALGPAVLSLASSCGDPEAMPGFRALRQTHSPAKPSQGEAFSFVISHPCLPKVSLSNLFKTELYSVLLFNIEHKGTIEFY